MGLEVIVYGTKITCDTDLPLDLPLQGVYRHEIALSAGVPEKLKESITCGFPFYFAHGRNVYLYGDREFDGNAPGQPWCYDELLDIYEIESEALEKDLL